MREGGTEDGGGTRVKGAVGLPAEGHGCLRRLRWLSSLAQPLLGPSGIGLSLTGSTPARPSRAQFAAGL